jgi:hypothetical protein
MNNRIQSIVLIVSGVFFVLECSRNGIAEEDFLNSTQDTHMGNREERQFHWDYECLGCPNGNYFPETLDKECRFQRNCSNYLDTAIMVRRLISQGNVSRVSFGTCGSFSYISMQDGYSSGWTRLFNLKGDLVSMYVRADTNGYCGNSTIFECFGRSIRCSKVQREVLENSENGELSP